MRVQRDISSFFRPLPPAAAVHKAADKNYLTLTLTASSCERVRKKWRFTTGGTEGDNTGLTDWSRKHSKSIAEAKRSKAKQAKQGKAEQSEHANQIKARQSWKQDEAENDRKIRARKEL